jgi:prepilin-type N-terminal cleavage/methylation domain-containing protein
VDKRGLSLVELIIALLLLGVVATGTVRIVTGSMRSFRRQAARSQIQTSLRTAVAIVASELRELGSVGDLIEIAPASITYRAMRKTAFLCRTPDPRQSEITLWRTPAYGLRQLEAGRDSILIFAENDPRIAGDNTWLSAAVVAVVGGAFCPGRSSGFRVRLSGMIQGSLAGVDNGAPVRGFQVTQLLLYHDSRRVYWLGWKEWRLGSGWSITQPVLGPLAPAGLRFDYLDSSGRATDSPSRTAVITLKLVAQSSGRAVAVAGANGMVTDSVTTSVALRNVASLPIPESE